MGKRHYRNSRLSNPDLGEKETNRRIKFLGIFILLFGATLGGRLFFLQVRDFEYFSALARGQQYSFEVLTPPRGEIFLQGQNDEKFPLATNKTLYRVYLNPKEINKEEADFAKKISSILGISIQEVLEKIKDKDIYYKILASRVEQDKILEIEKLNLKGVYFHKEILRYYPYKDFASQILGFVSSGEKKSGQYGLEKYFDGILSGEKGYYQGGKDARGNWIFSRQIKKKIPKKGVDLYLTIDYNVQHRAEEALKEAKKRLNFERGLIIVQEPKTGKIKALANFPNFDPNNYGAEKDLDIFRNDAVERIFEPGSVFKPITLAAALDTGEVSPETTYSDPGEIKFGSYTIKNYDEKSHGVQTMIQVLEKSLNTGAVFVQQKIGKEKFKEYVEKFDFGQPTGIELPNELSGDIKNLNTRRDINYATASFGQGIAVTPLQFIKAIGAIANSGVMMKPYLVEKKVYSSEAEELIEPRRVKEVISPETAAYLSAMMVSVVKSGHAKRAQIPGYFIAGKTGTAQVAEGGRYSPEKTIHSFVGFFPAFNPQFLILVKLDNPRGVRFAESSAVPVFRELAQYIINYYKIPPDYPEEIQETQ